ncbi:thiol reductant ABC exporter subunit CydD [Microbacterium rhizomatis]|uniref:Thiol reductant ABC exporter subunit CydD n=1 Tax=Microbacterium rhizomatis TaxID=1631477 RepID=A0A5J5J2J2_9MICO|nr:thiol reductant ABC exporter subunit CydD [Microbacterium rhizomatis]KAA9107633.1 thiol reductant ABC exporter subunit CydD [Microbacterium rhizomatis]
MASDSADAPRDSIRPVDPRLLRYARASRGFFVVIALIGGAQAIVIIAFAWLLTRAIVGAIDGMPALDLAATLALLALAVSLRAALLWARDAVAARAAATVQTQLRGALVDAVGALGPGWLSSRNSAQLAVTAGHGLDALEAYFGRYLPQLVQTVIATPLIVIVMWWEDWISGLTVLLTLPLIPVFMVLIGMATRSVQKRQWRTLHALAARFADTVQGLSTLKVFGRQHRAAASIEQVTERYRTETMRVLRVSFLSGFALELLASISVAIIAVTIGFRLLDGSLTLVAGLFVLLLAPEAYLPIRQVGVQFHAAAEGVTATDDVFAVLDAAGADAAAPRRTDVTDADSPDSGGTLSLRGVRVMRGERVLPPVDLEVASGEVLLVEGPSGAGKSSLLAALSGAARFEGTATWRGHDVRDLAPPNWLAWAGQQAGLIAGRIGDNVALGDTRPDPVLVRDALRRACAGELDPDLELGVQGSGLSGGQAQRVAVARAFYRHLRGRAPVLAIDEPSAALDAETEARMWRSIRELANAGAAVVVVSHRTSARSIADRVVALLPAEVNA